MKTLVKKLMNKKGQLGMGSLSPAVLALMSLAVVLAVAYIVMNNFRDTQVSNSANVACSNESTDAVWAMCNMTDALNDNLVANLSIVVIVVVFAVVLGLVAMFRTRTA